MSSSQFESTGPLHLSSVDWSNAKHRTAVAASLVRGVYILERDQLADRKGRGALANQWWDFFNFELIDTIVDTKICSKIGAIYRYKFFDLKNNAANGAPKYVIAFRGTIPFPFVTFDLTINWKLIRKGLKNEPRFNMAMDVVENFISTRGTEGRNIWLAGHSLGASMALKAGKSMALKGISLETHLFNPPFLSVSLEKIVKSEKARNVISGAHTFLATGLGLIVSRGTSSSEDTFDALVEWKPNLYVHPADFICSGYIQYFKNRKNMEKMGPAAAHIENFATKHSVRGLIKGALGMDHEAFHLIPSAVVNVNNSPAPTFCEAHGLHRWWGLDFNPQTTIHKYGSNDMTCPNKLLPIAN